VIDPGASYIDASSPQFSSYSRQFFAQPSFSLDRDPVLLMWVRTKYSISGLARVEINGNFIGAINPRPRDPNLPFVTLEAESFIFSQYFLTFNILPWDPLPPNTLTVIPAAGPQNALWVGHVTLLQSRIT